MALAAVHTFGGRKHDLLSVLSPGTNSEYRSKHNTRIERLWYDTTEGYSQKWKNFFYELETHCRLNPESTWHIWLLHFLFIGAIQEDAQEWVSMWNNHTMQIRGMSCHSHHWH